MLLTDSHCDRNCLEALCGQGNNYPSTLFFPLISSRNLTKYIFHCHCHPRAVFVRMVHIYIICLSSSEYFCNGGSAAGLWMGVSEWTVPGTSGIAGEPSLLSPAYELSAHCSKVCLLQSGIEMQSIEKGQEYCVRGISKTRLWLTPSLFAVWELQCFGYPPAQLISPFMSCQERPKKVGSVLVRGVMQFCGEAWKKSSPSTLQRSCKKYVRLHVCPTGKFL